MGRRASPVLTSSFTSSHIPSFADDLTAPRRNTVFLASGGA
jgi:hypothetical protein